LILDTGREAEIAAAGFLGDSDDLLAAAGDQRSKFSSNASGPWRPETLTAMLRSEQAFDQEIVER
jgi:hypothetical protein